MIEIAIAVAIMVLIMMLAVPSISGVIADRRLRRSLDELNSLVRKAQEQSGLERRAYLIAWDDKQLVLRPESLNRGESDAPTAVLRLERGDAFVLELPAALTDEPPAEWIFWPSGTCEPAVVKFKGVNGSWTARYSSLTGRPELTNYAAR